MLLLKTYFRHFTEGHIILILFLVSFDKDVAFWF